MKIEHHREAVEEISGKLEKLRAKIEKLEEEERRLSIAHSYHLDGIVSEMGRESKKTKSSSTQAKLLDVFNESPKPKKLTVFGATKAFFDGNNNDWATIQEITENTGKGKESVRQVLYKTHAASFERTNKKGLGVVTEFRLAAKKEQA